MKTLQFFALFLIEVVEKFCLPISLFATSGTLKKTSKQFSGFAIIAPLLLTLSILVLFSIAPKTINAGSDQQPSVRIHQERPGEIHHCFFPFSCVNENHHIFYEIKLHDDGSGNCYLPDFNVPFDHNTLTVRQLSISEQGRRKSSSPQGFVPGEPLSSDCSFAINLVGSPDFQQVVDFPVPGDYEIKIEIKETYRLDHLAGIYKQGVYNFTTPLVITREQDCPNQRDCAGTPEWVENFHWQLCNQTIGVTNIDGSPNREAWKNCYNCISEEGLWTALGCIKTDAEDALKTLIKIGILLGGGICLIVILAGSFTLSISQGDPKKTSEAKEMITSAIIGLIFIIFSVSILQFIGVQVFRIPEFGEPEQHSVK